VHLNVTVSQWCGFGAPTSMTLRLHRIERRGWSGSETFIVYVFRPPTPTMRVSQSVTLITLAILRLEGR
jgi:hypothetical protein